MHSPATAHSFPGDHIRKNAGPNLLFQVFFTSGAGQIARGKTSWFAAEARN
jgi:hypothetical protein